MRAFHTSSSSPQRFVFLNIFIFGGVWCRTKFTLKNVHLYKKLVTKNCVTCPKKEFVTVFLQSCCCLQGMKGGQYFCTIKLIGTNGRRYRTGIPDKYSNGLSLMSPLFLLVTMIKCSYKNENYNNFEPRQEEEIFSF